MDSGGRTRRVLFGWGELGPAAFDAAQLAVRRTLFGTVTWVLEPHFTLLDKVEKVSAELERENATRVG